MILSDKTIAEYVKNGKIKILPDFDLSNIRPVGIRLHLGRKVLVPMAGQTIDLGGTDNAEYEKIEMTDEGYILKSGDFILASTYEKFQVPRDIVCQIDGRSTVARLGLSITLHFTNSGW